MDCSKFASRMKRYFLHILFVLILLPYSKTLGQNVAYITSLEKQIEETKENEKKADLYRELAFEFISIDSKKALKYAKQSIELSQKNNYSHGETEGLNVIAIIEKNAGNYVQSLSLLKTALNLSQKANDTSSMARCYLNIGDVYSTLKNYQKAISNYENALELNQNIKNHNSAIISLNRIANRNMDIGNYQNDTNYIYKAIELYEKAKLLSEQLNDSSKIINSHINLADAYNILGKKTNNKNHLFYSLDFSLRALKLSRFSKIKSLEIISLINIGEAYESLKNISKAIHYYEIAEKECKLTGDHRWMLNIHTFLAKAYFALNNELISIDHINEGITIARKENLKEYLRDFYQLLSRYHLTNKNYNEAFEAQEKYILYKDSLINENTAINISRLQTELDIDKKDMEIKLLNKNAEIQSEKIRIQTIQRNYLLIAILGFIILLAIVYYRYREKQKSEQQILKAKNIAEQAKEAQELFLANTSHEIRTPMNGIIGMTHQLMDTDLTQEQQEYIDAIQESSNNLLVIINDLLDLSKIRAGKMIFEKRIFKLDDVFKNLMHSLQYRLNEKKLSLSSEVDAKIPEYILGDSVRLSQILLNLAGNALKFTEKGFVRINASLQSENDNSIKILFSVSDSGIGIPKEKLKTIFDSFTQVNSKTTKKYGGTGLGLSIAKQLIEQQGGEIFVQSTLNEGSQFSFILEFNKTKVISPKSLKSNKQAISSFIFNNINVLIVDDNKINQRVAALTLQKWKAKSQFADDAQSAIYLLKNKKFDIVLMDISMPEIDGLEATQIIRTTVDSTIPIIAITASALVGEKERCLAAGMNDYISKPFHPDELFIKIKQLLPTEKLNYQEPVCDLTSIINKADGDNEYLKDILSSYVTEMPIYTNELLNAQKEKNYHAIGAQAHKMRSPAALLGAKKMVELLSEIEKNCKENKVDNIFENIDKVAKLVTDSIVEIKKEIERIQ